MYEYLVIFSVADFGQIHRLLPHLRNYLHLSVILAMPLESRIRRVGTSGSMCSFGYIAMVALLHALPKDVVTNPEKLLPLLWRIIKIDEQTIDWPSFLDLLLPSVPPSLSTIDLSSVQG